ncbi:MAG: LytTR family DNA-binding domain-containing protein [Streptosporangiales bacterium]|nr:LytTR family DNA-binding domain-containing protein [Streptosporangiales bacterium]
MTRRNVSALVVDDEAPARNELCFQLRTALGVSHVDTARDSSEALRRVQQRRFDVVFTDIVFPGLNGIEMASVLSNFPAPPAVVIVTEHDQYAVRAFEVGACDYLLKPVSRNRLATALGRALERGGIPRSPGRPPGWAGETAGSGYATVPRQPDGFGGFAGFTGAGADDPSATIPVDTGGRTRFVSREEVRWVEAQGDYVRLHMADGETYLIRIPISRLAEMWADFGFIRIHRGYLVPFKHVTEFSAAGGNHTVTVDGHALPVSRRHVRDLRDRFLNAGWRT